MDEDAVEAEAVEQHDSWINGNRNHVARNILEMKPGMSQAVAAVVATMLVHSSGVSERDVFVRALLRQGTLS